MSHGNAYSLMQVGEKWGVTADPARGAGWPQPNGGIVISPQSGFFVVEADVPQGHDLDGIGNLAAQIDQNRRLSNNIEALSLLGSRHIYIKWLDAEDIANSASQLAPGVAARVGGECYRCAKR